MSSGTSSIKTVSELFGEQSYQLNYLEFEHITPFDKDITEKLYGELCIDYLANIKSGHIGTIIIGSNNFKKNIITGKQTILILFLLLIVLYNLIKGNNSDAEPKLAKLIMISQTAYKIVDAELKLIFDSLLLNGSKPSAIANNNIVFSKYVNLEQIVRNHPPSSVGLHMFANWLMYYPKVVLMTYNYPDSDSHSKLFNVINSRGKPLNEQ